MDPVPPVGAQKSLITLLKVVDSVPKGLPSARTLLPASVRPLASTFLPASSLVSVLNYFLF